MNCYLRPASDNPQFTWPVIVNRFPSPPFNVPLQIGKFTPRGTCTLVWEPLL